MHHFHTLVFDADTLRRLSNPFVFLNSSAINGCSALLYDLKPREDVVIFSSYDLTRMRDGTSDSELWRHTKHTKFWQRHMWIIPVHRMHQVHWTSAVVNTAAGTIELFDSLADKRETEKDLQVHV